MVRTSSKLQIFGLLSAVLVFAQAQVGFSSCDDRLLGPISEIRKVTDSLAEIEGAAYRELERIPGVPGLIRFNEVIDEAVRERPEFGAALLPLVLKRLPYLKKAPFVVFVSGGVADPWTPVLEKAAEEANVQIRIVKLPGSLSFARGGNQKQVPEFPAELKAFLKTHASVFLDDTYTNGGTAMAVREAVKNAGGTMDGVFIVYEGGKGNPASLYKTGRNNQRQPSMVNFPFRPKDWKWVVPIDRGLGVELNGTLFNANQRTALTPQGRKLLQEAVHLGMGVKFLRGGVPVAAPDELRALFPTLRILGETEPVVLSIGSWGRDFRGPARTTPGVSGAYLETLKIGAYREEGVLSEDLLDEDYFLNRLSEAGILEPVFEQIRPAAVARELPKVLDLRSVEAPKAEKGSHHLAELFQEKADDPKARVAALSKVRWDELTDEEQALMLRQAPGLTNSFEIGAYIKIAGSSKDSRWRVILEKWISDWKDIQRGWQTFIRPEAEKALREIP